MKQLIFLLFTISLICTIAPVNGQTPEDEQIAKSLYLKASKSIRAENYTEASRLLTRILDEYPDSEVALLADEKLTEIADKAKLAGLPKTPGFYLVETNGKIVEMTQRPLKKGAPYEYETQWATFSQEELPEIFADELSKFIVFRPKGNLQDVAWNVFYELIGVNEKGEKVGSGNWKMFNEWEVNSIEGRPFGSNQVIFEEIKPGMWEVGFPIVFSPAKPIIAGLCDGSDNVGLFVIQSKMIHSFYPFLEFWKTTQINLASNKYIKKQLEKHPDNPDLHFFDAILTYKIAYKQDKPQTEAAMKARKALELAKENDMNPKAFSDLNVLLDYCVADSIVRANTINYDDPSEVKLQKHKALRNMNLTKIPPDLFWIQAQVARNYAHLGEFDQAIIVAEKAVKTFKDKKPSKGLFGGLIKVEITLGEPKQPDAFSIHDALTCYTLDPEWDMIKDMKDEMESEKFLAQALELINSGGSDNEIETALKEAKSKNKNNIRCYEAMVNFYTKIGKPNDADKARKDIEKANKRRVELAMERISTTK